MKTIQFLPISTDMNLKSFKYFNFTNQNFKGLKLDINSIQINRIFGFLSILNLGKKKSKFSLLLIWLFGVSTSIFDAVVIIVEVLEAQEVVVNVEHEA